MNCLFFFFFLARWKSRLWVLLHSCLSALHGLLSQCVEKHFLLSGFNFPIFLFMLTDSLPWDKVLVVCIYMYIYIQVKIWSCLQELTYYTWSPPHLSSLKSIDKTLSFFDIDIFGFRSNEMKSQRKRGLCSWFKVNKKMLNCPAWSIWSVPSGRAG